MKKQPNTIQLQIPEPCFESWDDMVPLPGGRYCSKCEKTVVDFTQLTDQETLRLFLRRQGRACGRFREDQLNKALPLPEPIGRWQKYRAFGALLSGLFLSGTAAAQAALQQPPPIVQTVMRATVPEGRASKIVEGIVTDQSGEPLIGANVILKGPVKSQWFFSGTCTDLDGYFYLTVPAETKGLQLAVSYLGYEGQLVALESGNSNFEIQLQWASQELAEVVVIAHRPPLIERSIISGLATGRRTDGKAQFPPETAAEPVEILNVYPNPFTSWLQVELQLEQPQSMLFHLYDASGKLVFAQAEGLPQGRANLRLELEGRHLPAGRYFLRVSDEAGEVRTKGVVKALP
ncbi:MAG: carboxypeptidase-like regulatory domain-containing protein [Phaeodactylibacter sp.]|nr:carboxypeptidase-like regulatory domain-containing protein [Phaeodactylibacter sp.]MCB9304234.1 carboxypeptidase-like regulatory domain-containing protein [Lewinellaceae bacterium]